ncbi:hypothetical protein [Streptomyces sp. NPDC058614]|uniref:hypothetical protein n=1 Tax=Streptomyces sp. NPDC058614 TaxID=3346557 RepID=UPI003652EADB
MRLTIDTETDTYDEAIAAVQAAFGLRPVVPAGWLNAPAVEPRPGPEDLSTDDLGEGWSDRMLFETVAALVPGARAVLRRIADVGGSASCGEVQRYFADHPDTPIPPKSIGGTLTSIRAVRRRIGPDGPSMLLERDDRARLYRIEPVLVGGLQRAFVLADARPDLLRS